MKVASTPVPTLRQGVTSNAISSIIDLEPHAELDMPPSPRPGETHPGLVWLPLALGVALRLQQWRAATSMWLDELYIALNVRERGLLELLSAPLDNRQMAPIGFLAPVDVATTLFGLNEFTLRLVPTLLSITALFLLWRVAARLCSGIPLGGTLLLAAVSPALIWYGGNVKQYAGDVALTLLLLLLTLRHFEEPRDRARAVIAATLGFFCLLSSQAAVLVAAALGTILAARWFVRRRELPLTPLAILGSGWTAGALFAMWLTLRTTTPGVRQFMRDFWADGFAPWDQGVLAIVTWTARSLFSTLAHALVFLDEDFGALAIPAAALALLGLLTLPKASRFRALVVAAPIVAALTAAMAHLMPMSHRLAIYVGPSILIFTALGLQTLLRHESRGVRLVGGVAAVLTLVPLPLIVLTVSRPPLRSPETRPVIAELGQRLNPGDQVFAYCYAAEALEYYGTEYGVPDFEEVPCAESEEDLDRTLTDLGPGRFWFFSVDVPEAHFAPRARDILERMGRVVDEIDDPFASAQRSQTRAIYAEVQRASGAEGVTAQGDDPPFRSEETSPVPN